MVKACAWLELSGVYKPEPDPHSRGHHFTFFWVKHHNQGDSELVALLT